MSYKILDPTLERWRTKHGLHVHTTYRGEEVRSIDIVSPAGKRFQIWLDMPGSEGKIMVHVWDYQKRRREFDSDLSNLESQLERAYSEVKSWF